MAHLPLDREGYVEIFHYLCYSLELGAEVTEQ